MIHFIKILFLVAISNIFIANLSAQAKISIQGTLKDSKGAAVPDGSQTVTFKLYNVTTAGTSLWSETADVIVTGGIYSHYLGSVTPLNTSIFSNTLYLGVNIGSLELSPRIELTYAPYAFAVQEVVCAGAVGDIKYSILNPTQFAAANGACWVPMDGRSITGTRLNSITGQPNVPNGGGLFIRAQDFSNSDQDPERNSGSAIASYQEQSFLSHTHGMSTDGSHTHTGRVPEDGYSRQSEIVAAGFGAVVADDSGTHGHNQFTTDHGGSHTHAIYSAGGNETRPKNLNFWIYIRVN